jgi:hypothetical protein
MAMRVMRIGHVGMHMPNGLVPVTVAVLANRRHAVHMVVMAIVVAVRVFVLQRLVLVFVAVRLRQVQHHAGQG